MRTGPRTTPGEQPRPCRSSPDWRAGSSARRKSWPWYTGPRVSNRSSGGGPSVVSPELALAQRRERAQVGRRGAALDKSQHFVDFEIEDVARVVEHIERVEPPADLEKDAADAAEQPRALEPQVFAIANPPLRVPQDPREDDAPQGMRGQGLPDAPLRFDPEPIGRRTGRLGQVGPARRGDLLRERADGAKQRKRIVVQRRAFELQFVHGPIAELREVLADTARRMPGGRPARPDLVDTCRESAAGSARCARPARRASRCMRTAGSALTMPPSPPIRSFCSVPLGIAAPADHQVAQQAVEDHREEIVDERRIPAEKQPALAGRDSARPVRRCADLRAAAPAAPARRRAAVERVDPAIERQVVRDQPAGRANAVQRVERAAAADPARDLGGQRVGQRLLHAHHLFHEPPVHLIAGQQREHAIPVQRL